MIELSGTRIWATFARAIGTELRPDTTIRGFSGLEHSVQAIAVDDKHKRIVVISAEGSPRTAALMQVDVQATMPGSRVIVARPVGVDLAQLVKRVAQPLGVSELDISRARQWVASLKNKPADAQQEAPISPELQGIISNAFSPISRVNTQLVPLMPMLASLAEQVEQLPWQQIASDIGKIFGETAATGTLSLESFLAADSLAADLKVGVCPIPLYDFTDHDMELFSSGMRLDDAKARLIELGLFQYFFPSLDQLALGIIDQGIRDGSKVQLLTEAAPSLGHPFGEPELVPTADGLIQTVEQLKDLGYLADGEFGIEVSPAGKVVRSSLKFKPREGLISKILNRFSVSASVSPADFLK